MGRFGGVVPADLIGSAGRHRRGPVQLNCHSGSLGASRRQVGAVANRAGTHSSRAVRWHPPGWLVCGTKRPTASAARIIERSRTACTQPFWSTSIKPFRLAIHGDGRAVIVHDLLAR
jgi:hypothetical protein